MPDAFISYALDDADFVQRLQRALVERGVDARIDGDAPARPESTLAAGAEIEASDSFLLIVSPSSVASPRCRGLVNHAEQQGKRLVPVVCRDVNTDDVPEPVQAHNWIFCRERDDFDGAVDAVVTGIRTDFDWVHEHTRLLVRATEWDGLARDRSFLLRSSDLEAAEAWRSKATERTTPQPTRVQLEYLAESRRAATRGVRFRIGLVSAALVVALALAVVALLARNQARDRAQLALARELAASSVAEQPQDSELSLLLAVESMKRVRTEAGERALRQAIADSRLRRTIRVSKQQVESVSVSPDGQEIVAGTRDGTVRLYRLASGKRMTQYVGEKTENVNTVAFSPDGNQVLMVAGGIARLLDVHRGVDQHVSLSPSLVLDQDPAAVFRGAFSRDGSRIVTADFDGNARIWDATSGGPPLVVLAAGSQLSDAEFSSAGTRVVTTSAGADTSTRIFDAEQGGPPLVTMDSPTTEPWFAAVWVAGDSQVVTGGTKGTTYFDANTGERLASYDGAVDEVAVSPLDNGVVTANVDGTADVRDASTKVVRSLRSNGGVDTSVAYTPDAKLVITASADGKLRLWATDRLVPGARDVSVNHLALSRDGQRALTVTGAAQTVTLYRVTRRGLRTTGRLELGSVAAAAAFSPDGRSVVTGGDDGTVRVFRVADGHELQRVVQAGHPVGTVAFSPSGARILATYGTGENTGDRVLVYDWPHLAHEPVEITDTQASDAAYFAPDGKRLLTIGNDGRARMWALAHSARPVQTFKNASGLSVFGRAAFSPAADRLAITDYDSSAAVWDVDRPSAPALIFRRPPGPIWDAAFSPDGTKLVTAGDDGTVTLWDARAGGEPLAIMRLQGGSVFTVRFGTDGSHLLTGGANGTVQWFSCTACAPSSRLLALAEHRVTRELTSAERQRFHTG